MSQMAARYRIVETDEEAAVPARAFLPLQLAAVADATGGLIANGLAVRAASPLTDDTGALRREIAPLALAYEAALLASLTPDEVRTLRRLLTRIETAALKLSGRA